MCSALAVCSPSSLQVTPNNTWPACNQVVAGGTCIGSCKNGSFGQPVASCNGVSFSVPVGGCNPSPGESPSVGPALWATQHMCAHVTQRHTHTRCVCGSSNTLQHTTVSFLCVCVEETNPMPTAQHSGSGLAALAAAAAATTVRLFALCSLSRGSQSCNYAGHMASQLR